MLRRPSERAERITFVVFVVAVLGLFCLEVFRDYEPAKLTALFCVAMWFPLIALHEVGHAVVAHLFGFRVARVSVGFGKTLWQFDIGDTVVDIKAIPVEGFVRFSPGPRPASRIQNALVYFAGPGAELLIAALVVLLVGPDVVLSGTDHLGVLFAQSVCLVAVLGATLNLIPHHARADLDARSRGERPVPNDGLGIILSLLGRSRG